MYPVIDLPISDDHIGDPGIESRILTAVTGIEYTVAHLNLIGERIFNLQRAILLREGQRAGRDDLLPEEFHNQPLEGHVADPECIVPDRKGAVNFRLGSGIDMWEYIRLREEFYELRGWDVPSGLQTRAGLQELDLPEVAEELEARSLLAPRARRVPAHLRLARRVRFRLRGSGRRNDRRRRKTSSAW